VRVGVAAGVGMDWTEFGFHSFVVRVWLEEGPADGVCATWRGQVTHIPSGAHRYVSTLAEIPDFIEPYLEGMGVRVGRPRRGPPRWLQRLRGP
jgi:hypothetical protein